MSNARKEQDHTAALDRMLQLATGYQASKVLFTAVRLGLFTELAARPLPCEELRLRLGLHPAPPATSSTRSWPSASWTAASTATPTPPPPPATWTAAGPATWAASWRWPTPASTTSGARSWTACAPASRRTRSSTAGSSSTPSTRTRPAARSSSRP
ncbi:methyltransferase dimerization domain-containing protein [Streptomyces stramineus]